MNTDALERDLEQFLQHTDYEVRFQHWYGESVDVYVVYGADIIAEKTFHGTMFGNPPSYERAAKWALRVIKRHQKAMRMIGGIVR